MAVIESFDYEDGTSQGWNTGTSADITTEVATEAALGGSNYGMRVVHHTQNSVERDSSITLQSTYTDIHFQFKFKIISGSEGQYGGAYWRFTALYYNAGEFMHLVLHWTGSEWQLRYDTLEQSLETDTEYLLEYRFVRDASVGGVQIWLDEVSLYSDFTNDTTNYSAVNRTIIGALYTYGNMTAGSGFMWDDVKVGDAYIGVPTPTYTLPHYVYGDGS